MFTEVQIEFLLISLSLIFIVIFGILTVICLLLSRKSATAFWGMMFCGFVTILSVYVLILLWIFYPNYVETTLKSILPCLS